MIGHKRRRVADAIRRIDRAELLRGYEGIDPDSFYALCTSEEDFEATWDSFRELILPLTEPDRHQARERR